MLLIWSLCGAVLNSGKHNDLGLNPALRWMWCASFDHSWYLSLAMHMCHYLFWGFWIESTSLSLCCCKLAYEKSMVATFWAFCAEYFLWCSDLAKLGHKGSDHQCVTTVCQWGRGHVSDSCCVTAARLLPSHEHSDQRVTAISQWGRGHVIDSYCVTVARLLPSHELSNQRVTTVCQWRRGQVTDS